MIIKRRKLYVVRTALHNSTRRQKRSWSCQSQSKTYKCMSDNRITCKLFILIRKDENIFVLRIGVFSSCQPIGNLLQYAGRLQNKQIMSHSRFGQVRPMYSIAKCGVCLSHVKPMICCGQIRSFSGNLISGQLLR